MRFCKRSIVPRRNVHHASGAAQVTTLSGTASKIKACFRRHGGGRRAAFSASYMRTLAQSTLRTFGLHLKSDQRHARPCKSLQYRPTVCQWFP
jgi:hypothetical protein